MELQAELNYCGYSVRIDGEYVAMAHNGMNVGHKHMTLRGAMQAAEQYLVDHPEAELASIYKDARVSFEVEGDLKGKVLYLPSATIRRMRRLEGGDIIEYLQGRLHKNYDLVDEDDDSG